MAVALSSKLRTCSPAPSASALGSLSSHSYLTCPKPDAWLFLSPRSALRLPASPPPPRFRLHKWPPLLSGHLGQTWGLPLAHAHIQSAGGPTGSILRTYPEPTLLLGHCCSPQWVSLPLPGPVQSLLSSAAKLKSVHVTSSLRTLQQLPGPSDQTHIPHLSAATWKMLPSNLCVLSDLLSSPCPSLCSGCTCLLAVL